MLRTVCKHKRVYCRCFCVCFKTCCNASSSSRLVTNPSNLARDANATTLCPESSFIRRRSAVAVPVFSGTWSEFSFDDLGSMQLGEQKIQNARSTVVSSGPSQTPQAMLNSADCFVQYLPVSNGNVCNLHRTTRPVYVNPPKGAFFLPPNGLCRDFKSRHDGSSGVRPTRSHVEESRKIQGQKIYLDFVGGPTLGRWLCWTWSLFEDLRHTIRVLLLDLFSRDHGNIRLSSFSLWREFASL